jgi:hypothetical protein
MVIRALGAVSTYILVQSGPPPGMGIELDYCKDGTVVSEQSLSMVAIMKLCTYCHSAAQSCPFLSTCILPLGWIYLVFHHCILGIFGVQHISGIKGSLAMLIRVHKSCSNLGKHCNLRGLRSLISQWSQVSEFSNIGNAWTMQV